MECYLRIQDTKLCTPRYMKCKLLKQQLSAKKLHKHQDIQFFSLLSNWVSVSTCITISYLSFSLTLCMHWEFAALIMKSWKYSRSAAMEQGSDLTCYEGGKCVHIVDNVDHNIIKSSDVMIHQYAIKSWNFPWDETDCTNNPRVKKI